MFLLDTNVISELRKSKTSKIHPNVKAWAEGVSSINLFLSVITILELEMGIGLIARRDTVQATLLQTWLNQYVLPTFHERILCIDISVALRCGKLHVLEPRSDRDALIAATALVHDMIVVTRNVSDFTDFTDLQIENWFD